RRWGRKLGQCLVYLQFLTEADLTRVLSKVFRLPVIDLARIDPIKITKDLLSKITVQQARTHRVVPLALRDLHRRKHLIVATSEPADIKYLDELQFRLGMPVQALLAPDSDIEWFIRKYYMGEQDILNN